MAVQSKTLVNDVGSAVVEEIASQLNRAADYISICDIDCPGGVGDSTEFLALFTEDVLVEQVTFALFDGAAATGLDQNGDIVTLLSGVAADFSGGVTLFNAQDFNPSNAVRGVFHTPTSLNALASTVVTGTLGPWRVDAGDTLALRLTAAGGSGIIGGRFSAWVTYRPVKDSLAFKPTFIQTMRNFSSRDR